MSMDVPFPIGTPLPFFGVDNHLFKVGDVVYAVLEDDNDGYRSALGCVEERSGEGIFFGTAVDTVIAEPLNEPATLRPYRREFDGWVLRSAKDGHEWLRFGTEDYTDYYPCFVFRYSPRTDAP